jgi:hypothetical protein
MYHLNSEYDFVRTATGKTSSVTVAVSVYDEETIPTKSRWMRTGAEGSRGAGEEFDIPDWSGLTPVETQYFVYNIPTDKQTMATPIDRSSNADTDLGQYEEYFYKIRDEVEKDSVYESLNQKYMPSS